MIKSFFHNLNSHKVNYILISGQAAVLYGAATFSEDIDIWVSPEIENWNKFLGVLKKFKAKIYKLTPPLTEEHIRKGHGFHFEFPEDNRKMTWFLDVMGVVPRIKSFSKALESVNFYKTPWGTIPVIGLRDLAELKKTRRLQDYAIISNLARIEYENFSNTAPDKVLKWILSNSFDIEDIIFYFKSCKNAVRVGRALNRKCLGYCVKIIKIPDKERKYFSSASKALALEIEELRQKDRDYWREIIQELKELGKNGELLKRGGLDYEAKT